MDEILESNSSKPIQQDNLNKSPLGIMPPISNSIHGSSIIVNLSNVKLTDNEKSVLEKGLNFSIIEKKVDKEILLDDIYKFSQKLELRTFFDSNNSNHVQSNNNAGKSKSVNDPHTKETVRESSDNENDNENLNERSDMSGKIRNPYWNPKKNPPNALVLYIKAIKESICALLSKNTSFKDNLTQDQRIALSNLKQREDIVIQQADKGGKIVIMNKDDYVNACNLMLEDKEFYEVVEEDSNINTVKEIRNNLEKLGEYITDKEKKYIEEDLDNPRIPVFYGLPKIHKLFTNIPPMRPIVSGFCSCTCKLSEFLDSFLKYQAKRCNSYIKDTNHFLQKLKALKDLPSNSILVTLDVTSLYTNIDQDEGAEACFKKLEQRKRKDIPSNLLKNLILLILKCNVFRFGATLYSQIKGTCMGTPMAPNFANIFMDDFEERLIDAFYCKTGKRPLVWWRYIDDIFCIWTDGEESLQEFLEFTNNFSENENMRSNIKFTTNQSTQEVNFLDVTVKLNDGIISTTIYSKPTDSHLYLNSGSNHPSHVIRNIPKSQFMRLRRICSDTVDFSNQCARYENFFVQRGYDAQKIRNTIREIAKLPRDDLILPSKKKADNRVVFACNWHPHLSQLPNILKEHHYLLENDRQLSRIFTETPLVAYRRAKTIRNEVVRTDLTPPPLMEIEKGTVPCDSCKSTCHLICKDTTIRNEKNGKSVNVKAIGNCNTMDIVYAANCKICNLLYVGETKEPLRKRFSKHRYDANKRPDNCELPSHINSMNHSFESDIEVTILEQGFKSDAHRKHVENIYICKLGTLAPEGLNEKLEHYAKEMYDIHQKL